MSSHIKPHVGGDAQHGNNKNNKQERALDNPPSGNMISSQRLAPLEVLVPVPWSADKVTVRFRGAIAFFTVLSVTVLGALALHSIL